MFDRQTSISITPNASEALLGTPFSFGPDVKCLKDGRVKFTGNARKFMRLVAIRDGVPFERVSELIEAEATALMTLHTFKASNPPNDDYDVSRLLGAIKSVSEKAKAYGRSMPRG